MSVLKTDVILKGNAITGLKIDKEIERRKSHLVKGVLFSLIWLIFIFAITLLFINSISNDFNNVIENIKLDIESGDSILCNAIGGLVISMESLFFILVAIGIFISIIAYMIPAFISRKLVIENKKSAAALSWCCIIIYWIVLLAFSITTSLFSVTNIIISVIGVIIGVMHILVTISYSVTFNKYKDFLVEEQIPEPKVEDVIS